MRREAWAVLLLFAFAVPWEYSLDLGEPLGNVARIAGVLLIAVAGIAVIMAGRIRAPGLMQWLVMAFFLALCCSYFWTVDQEATLVRLRGYFQEMITVWLVWEFAERPEDLRALLRSYVAGSWVLAMLTLANLNSPESADQVRFAAAGQDPNDVARFLDLGFPMAALLLDGETHWTRRVLAAGYLPLGFAGVLLTASRGGFLAAIVGLAGCAVLLLRHHARAVLAGALALPAVVVALWFVMPRAALQRILTIPEQLQRGDLNQRLNIWAAGWQAFVHAPFFGTGTGTFVAAAGVAPIDTAHNTVLSIAVEGGVCTLLLAAAIVVAAACLVLKMTGAVRIAMATGLLVWLTTSLVATVEESRTTWLLLALIALAARLADEDPGGMTRCFAPPVTMAPLAAVLEP